MRKKSIRTGAVCRPLHVVCLVVLGCAGMMWAFRGPCACGLHSKGGAGAVKLLLVFFAFSGDILGKNSILRYKVDSDRASRHLSMGQKANDLFVSLKEGVDKTCLNVTIGVLHAQSRVILSYFCSPFLHGVLLYLSRG